MKLFTAWNGANSTSYLISIIGYVSDICNERVLTRRNETNFISDAIILQNNTCALCVRDRWGEYENKFAWLLARLWFITFWCVGVRHRYGKGLRIFSQSQYPTLLLLVSAIRIAAVQKCTSRTDPLYSDTVYWNGYSNTPCNVGTRKIYF